jgi:hypothetical protein
MRIQPRHAYLPRTDCTHDKENLMPAMRRRSTLLLLSLFLISSLLLVSCVAPATTTAPAASADETANAEPAAEGGGKIATFIFTQEFDTLNPIYTNMWFSSITRQIWNADAWAYDENNEAFAQLAARQRSQCRCPV